MKKKKIFSVIAIIIVVVAIMAVGFMLDSKPLHKSEQGKEDNKLKIGYIISGNKDDSYLYTAAYNGLMTVKNETQAYFSMRENIIGEDLETTAKTYADEGYSVIVLCGDGYDATVEKLAGEFPETDFIVLNSNLKNDKNLGSLYIDYRASGFVRGMLAGYVTKRNVVAAIGYTDDTATMHELYGFEKGVQYVDADIQVYGEYVTKRDDDITAGKLLEEFIGYGADIVISSAGDYDKEVFDVAETKGIYAFGGNSSYIEEYPRTILAVCNFDISGGVGDMVRMVFQDGFNGESIALEFDVEYNDGLKARLPGDGIKKVDQILNKLRGGELKIDELVPLEQ